MNTFLIFGSLFCYGVSAFFAYFAGKAELSWRQARRQPEVCGVWLLAFVMYVWMFVRIGPTHLAAIIGNIVAALIVAMCTYPIPMIGHDIGLNRKRHQRSTREES